MHESTRLLLSVVKETFANVQDDAMLRRLESCENKVPTRAQLVTDIHYIVQERQNICNTNFESLVLKRPQLCNDGLGRGANGNTSRLGSHFRSRTSPTPWVDRKPELMHHRPKKRQWVSQKDAQIGRPLFQDPITASKWDRQSHGTPWLGVRQTAEEAVAKGIRTAKHQAGRQGAFAGGSKHQSKVLGSSPLGL